LKDLEEMRGRLEAPDYKFLRRNGRTTLAMKEGMPAVEEAINFCRSAKQVPRLNWNEELYEAAKYHVEDTGKNGLVQHESTDGTTVKDRLSRYGKIITSYGENVTFNTANALEIVLQALVDDGVKNRGHRENLFNPEFR